MDGFQFIPDQSPMLKRQIVELHKLHRGQNPAEAEYNFLDHAKRLEMYGVHLYHANDAGMAEIQLGVTAHGIVVFQNRTRISTFSWSRILKISFKRKQFFVQLKNESTTIAESEEFSSTSQVVGFNLTSCRACKMLWKACIEHHTFFRLIAPPQAPSKGFFSSLGSSRYRFSGRTEYQTLEEMKRRARIERTFHRSGSRQSFTRSTIGPASGSSLLGVPTLPFPSVQDRRLSTAMSHTSSLLTMSPRRSPMVAVANGVLGKIGALAHFAGHTDSSDVSDRYVLINLMKGVQITIFMFVLLPIAVLNS